MNPERSKQEVIVVTVVDSIRREKSYPPLKCSHCDYSTDLKQVLRKHIELEHTNPHEDRSKNTCCVLCNYKSSRPQMMIHYTNTHDVNCSPHVLQFEHIGEFEEWKNKLEVEQQSRYIRCRGARRRNNNVIYQKYICHRDGFFVSQGKGKRRGRRVGSKKINGCCPSQINVTTNLLSGTVKINFVPTHVGHRNDLSIRSSESHEETIAGGESYERVTGDARDSLQIYRENLHLEDHSFFQSDDPETTVAVQPALLICEGTASKNDPQLLLLDQHSKSTPTKNDSFEKGLCALDDLFNNIKTELQTLSDIDIVRNHLKAVQSTIRTMKGFQEEFSCV